MAKKEVLDGGLHKVDHLFCDLVAEYFAKVTGFEPELINSAGHLYRISKDMAGEEGLSVAGFIEKIYTEETERTRGLRLARTVEPCLCWTMANCFFVCFANGREEMGEKMSIVASTSLWT